MAGGADVGSCADANVLRQWMDATLPRAPAHQTATAKSRSLMRSLSGSGATSERIVQWRLWLMSGAKRTANGRLPETRMAAPEGGHSVLNHRDEVSFVLGRPGSDLLFQALRLSTIGAGEFNGRVRNGIGYRLPAVTTRPAKDE